MPVSPADFALWARATGNKYPDTAEEKIAAAPHAYNYAKNLGRTGANAPGPRVGGSILYSQPEAVENSSPNSVFNAPVTPDNNISKVAGTTNQSLTSEHFLNQEREEQQDNVRQHQLINTIGKVALAAGLTAAGVAVARDPNAQQALRSAGSSLKESATNIGNRVSSFLGGFGGGRTPDPDVIRNSGDVTPATTGQRYQQQEVPVATQAAQVVTNDPNKARILQSVLEKHPITGTEPEYQPDIPHPASLRGTEYEQTFRYAPKHLIEARRAIASGAPLTDPLTGEIRNPAASVPGYKEAFASSPMQSEAIANSQTFGPQQNLATTEQPPAPSTFLEHQVAKVTNPAYGAVESEQTSGIGLPQGMAPHADPWTGEYTPLQETGKTPSFLKGQTYASGTVDPWRDPSALRSAVPATQLDAGSKLAQFIAEKNLQSEPSTVSVVGRFPGPEGSSAGGITFTPVQGEIEGKPARYTVLPRGATTEGESGPSALLTTGRDKYAEYGLTAPDVHVLPKDVLGKVQAFLGGRSTGPLQAHEKQALAIYQTTGDPAALETAFSTTPSMPVKIKLPGGERVATGELYTPFGAVVNPEALHPITGEPMPLVQLREEALLRAQGEQGIRSRIREQAMQKIAAQTGERPVHPSHQQLVALSPEQKRALRLGERDVASAEAALQSAKEMGTLFRLKPEAERGTYIGPEFETDPLTGKLRYLGLRPKVEQEAMATPAFYQMRAAGGAGRQEVGGIGRRREALQTDPGLVALGQAENEETGGAAFSIASPKGKLGVISGELEATPFLYRHVETNELLNPNQVPEQWIASGAVRPVRGTAVEPQRIMGSEGRTFKGVSATEIDPRSFDPVERAALAKQYPERVTPEGLIYSEQAMGGAEAAKQRARGVKAISESGVDPALGTRFSRRPPAPAGSARAERAALRAHRDQLVKQILSGQASAPTTQKPALSLMEKGGSHEPIRYQPEITEESISTWRPDQPGTQTHSTMQPIKPQFVGTEAPRSSLTRNIYTRRPIEFLGLYKTAVR